MPICGVYTITNTVNGKVYVGSSVNVVERWAEHRRQLRQRHHHSVPLQRAWLKYGEASFVFAIIELCLPSVAVEAEQRWFDRLKPWQRSKGYNVARDTKAFMRNAPAEVRSKISATLRARWDEPEFRAQMLKSLRGHPQTVETRVKIGEASRKLVRTAQHRARMSASQKGRVISAESRAKIAAARARQVMSPEHIAALNAGRRKVRAEVARV